MRKKIVVTGAAGFIGSNLCEALIKDSRVDEVLAIDNLSNGLEENISDLMGNQKFVFRKADIRDSQLMIELTKGYNAISHQAALGSVPRSIEDPLTSSDVNISGSLSILNAAVANDIDRVVHAFSSSTYGDSPALPKREAKIGNPLSPYAVTKYCNELFAEVFYKIYGLKYIGLRYFNVFGPKQNPNNPYAAVIPIFFKSILSDKSPVINGDGTTSRDFTYVDNVVQANIKSLFTDNQNALNQVYNVACGGQTSLNDLIERMNELTEKNIEANYREERKGDVKHSLADITKIKQLLGYDPNINVIEGLGRSLKWYKENL